MLANSRKIQNCTISVPHIVHLVVVNNPSIVGGDLRFLRGGGETADQGKFGSVESEQPTAAPGETDGNSSTYVLLDLIPSVLLHLIITTDQLDLAARTDGSFSSLSHGVVVDSSYKKVASPKSEHRIVVDRSAALVPARWRYGAALAARTDRPPARWHCKKPRQPEEVR